MVRVQGQELNGTGGLPWVVKCTGALAYDVNEAGSLAIGICVQCIPMCMCT